MIYPRYLQPRHASILPDKSRCFRTMNPRILEWDVLTRQAEVRDMFMDWVLADPYAEAQKHIIATLTTQLELRM